MTDWTGGLIERPRVPAAAPPGALVLIHIIEDDQDLPEMGRPRASRSVVARVKAVIAARGPISTHALAALLPDLSHKSVAVAARNLATHKEVRQAGKAPRAGNRGSGCAIWEIHPDEQA